jgi:hypothetical protein
MWDPPLSPLVLFLAHGVAIVAFAVWMTRSGASGRTGDTDMTGVSGGEEGSAESGGILTMPTGEHEGGGS